MVDAAQTTRCPVCGNDVAPNELELGGFRLYRCSVCTLHFAPEAFGVEVDYDQVYQRAEYEREQVSALKSLDARALAEHPTYRSFFRQVRHDPGSRLLDVGCGVGRFCHAAWARGWDVTGIDVSARAINSGRALARFPLRVASIEELVSQGEQFDVITAFEVLEHLTDPVEFLRTLRQLLSPGGQVFCTVPNWESRLVRASTRPDWLPPIHLLFFNAVSVRAAGEGSGLFRVTTGVIWSDPFPSRLLLQARWLARRLLARRQEPLGIWVHGWAEPA